MSVLNETRNFSEEVKTLKSKLLKLSNEVSKEQEELKKIKALLEEIAND